MSNENNGTAVVAEGKKAAKAELKAAKKAKKAEKEAEKLAEKIKKKAEKREPKATAEKTPSVPEPKQNATGKKSKTNTTKTKPAIGNSLSLVAKLQLAARAARSNLASGLLKHGLYAGQEQVLFLLDEHGPLALAEMAEKLDVRAPTITKTVTRMEAQGFLSRAVSRDDARSVIITLTPEGRRVMKIGHQMVKDTETAAFSCLNKEDRDSLSNCLDLVLSHIKT